MSIQRGRELFSKEQRKLFMKYPEDEWTIGSYYTFSKYDLEIIMKHRKEENKLGFAIQLAALRYPGWSYSSNKTIPIEIIQYIANQVCTVPKALKLYSLRNNTSRDHIKELKKEYGYSSFSTNDSKFLLKYLVNLAFENNDSLFLMNQSLEYLRKKKIILPAITTLENLVWEAKNKSEKFIINTIVSSLNPTQRNKLNDIVFLQSEKLKGKTILGWLKEPIGSPSPDNFLKVIEKLEYIRSLNLENTQLVKVHKNKINQIYSLAQRYEPYAFREFNIDKRHMLLSVFLLNLSKDLTDKAFEIHNRLIKVLEFKSTKSNEPILESIEIIKSLNESGKRKVPDNSPVDFISKRWKNHIFENDGSINRHYYEMAVLTELRDRVKAGDISISGSKQYKDFEDYLLSKNEWISSKENNKLSVSLSFDEYIQDRLNNLNERIRWLSKNMKNISTISIDNCKISISRLENITPKAAKELSFSLYKLLPKIKLTDLLMDIARITGFHKEFIHASTNKKPDTEDTILVMAALLGMGTNIGLSKMADATPGITYKQLSSVSQWRMYDDAMSRAQTVLVNYHNKLKLAKYWGEGNTSSSDGMRLQLGVSSLHADSNPHYGTGKGTTIYRFTSDQFSSYYSKIINTNSRDATHVLDGLLNNDTDLNIEEHYTDTAGYTDQVFALTYLLGFRFAPRIRDLSDVKLFTLNRCDKFSNLDGILKGKINEKIIKDNYDEVLRLASSIKEGTVTSSLIISKLASYSRQNSLATALREMGKIEKTIFILDYISSEELRRKIQKGLNKGEAMNGLARAIFFGKQGELRERTMQNQLQKASALNLIINAINIWNTLYLEKAISYKESIGEYIDYNLISHISPLGWEHINMLGEYTFNLNELESTELYRPLNI
ncbi:Tn3 family transposase [Clostridium perfringens]|uniref:Tn3 family transposase n=1 Tax=Clostridium perfringens TaxID=1502 RepID=UPI0037481948